jgi:GxxExxY protein
MKYQETTAVILNCFYTVYNILGFGFLEKVYEKALFNELSSRGLTCARQVPITVYYKEIIVGE